MSKFTIDLDLDEDIFDPVDEVATILEKLIAQLREAPGDHYSLFDRHYRLVGEADFKWLPSPGELAIDKVEKLRRDAWFLAERMRRVFLVEAILSARPTHTITTESLSELRLWFVELVTNGELDLEAIRHIVDTTVDIF